MLEKSVKEELQLRDGWQVYKHYEITEEDGDLFVQAPVESLRDLTEDVLSIYAPLQTTELLVDLARLADEPITPETVVGWAEVYGLLACSPEEDVVVLAEGISVTGEGRRDSVTRFADAAREVRACLRVYEAAKREGPVNLEELTASVGPLPPIFWKVLQPWERYKTVERPWLYGVIGRLVQERIREHCYPKLTIFTRSGNPSGRFGLGYGFNSLLGAIWLQVAWLLDSDDATRCKLPDCGRLITIEPGQAAPYSEFKDANGKWKSNVHGTYKTRKDIEFCKDRPCRQNYSYRKTAGWPGYT
jgi:hypothetical protein